jgi:hypothetical protein
MTGWNAIFVIPTPLCEINRKLEEMYGVQNRHQLARSSGNPIRNEIPIRILIGAVSNMKDDWRSLEGRYLCFNFTALRLYINSDDFSNKSALDRITSNHEIWYKILWKARSEN